MTTTMTKADLSGRIKFGYWYNLLHARLYRRLDKVITAFQLVMGTYVINGLIRDFTSGEAYVAAMVAVVGIAQQLLMLQAHGAVHQLASSDYLALEQALDEIDCDSAAAKLYGLYSKYPDGLNCIEEIAHEIVGQMHAPNDQRPELSRLAKTVKLVV